VLLEGPGAGSVQVICGSGCGSRRPKNYGSGTLFESPSRHFWKSRFFFIFCLLLEGPGAGSVQIILRIRMRIQKAQKITDPEHCFESREAFLDLDLDRSGNNFAGLES
jgi:hypothetical protein